MMQEPSMWEYYVNALGLKYGVLIPLASLVSGVVTILLLARGRGVWLAPTMLIVVLAPLVLGVVGTVDGIIAAILVVTHSTTNIHPSELAEVKSMSLVTIQVGLVLMLPGYLLAAGGSALRALRAPR